MRGAGSPAARDCQLYLITPPVIADVGAFLPLLKSALDGGPVAALQVRLKPASDAAITAVVEAVRPLARAREVALILNDRPDLAAALGCDGVHIGQDDGTVAQARTQLGAERIVGVTCHDSRHLAMTAAEEGADYVAFGAFFPTVTKDAPTRADPETLSAWQESMLTPCVAIGGIAVSNCRSLVIAGADYLAVASGVWAHPEGPGAAVAAFHGEMAAGLASLDPWPGPALP